MPGRCRAPRDRQRSGASPGGGLSVARPVRYPARHAIRAVASILHEMSGDVRPPAVAQPRRGAGGCPGCTGCQGAEIRSRCIAFAYGCRDPFWAMGCSSLRRFLQLRHHARRRCVDPPHRRAAPPGGVTIDRRLQRPDPPPWGGLASLDRCVPFVQWYGAVRMRFSRPWSQNAALRH